MNLLQLIRSFTRTAETGSIAAAARILGISATAVGQNINRLEAHLGVRLLNRSTRQLALSEAGALYLAQVRHIEADLARAQAMVTSGDIEPAGPLRIASSSAFGRHVLAPLLPSLQQRYPQLQLELRLTDRAVQHGPEAVDASIRIGAQLEDGVVARQLARVPFVFCASPAYLKAHGTPQEPAELGRHRGLLHRFPTDGRPLRWGLLKDGQRVDAALPPSMVCDDIDALASLAVAGAGITRLAAFVAEPYLRDGRLQAVFGADSAWRPDRWTSISASATAATSPPRSARCSNTCGPAWRRPGGCEPQRALNTPRASRGSQRMYCGAASTLSRRAAAACHGQRGS